MCYNHSHNILKENERIKYTIQRQNQWWGQEHDRLLREFEPVFLAAINGSTKDRHPVDGEPLDWE